jgi:fumarylacetoacetate (FAA) hydrolase family protein
MHRLTQDLPQDWQSATLLGRLLTADGPTPVLVVGGLVRDVSAFAPTTADFLVRWTGEIPEARDLGPLDDLDLHPVWEGEPGAVRLLAPIDLQCIKASGVTFAVSAVERVIEERARGEASRAEAIRLALRERVGADIRSVKPGSAEAKKLKDALIADGLWSQYLEVAIGPDAEIFTKAPVLSSVGWGDYVGVRSDSVWNNPEPEIVLACDPKGRILGAALGNDVNLRCIEGRSALLLGKAKDNNASCAIGPFIRLFDATFTLDDVRKAVVGLEVEGEDNYRLEGKSSMAEISRDPTELTGQTLGKHHRYPDGFVLFLGTMFAPTDDRNGDGKGFTHKPGDVVRVASEKLGVLINKVTTCDQAPPWTFGVGDLMRNLAARGLLRAEAKT